MFSWMKKSETEVPDTDSVISSLQKVRILIFNKIFILLLENSYFQALHQSQCPLTLHAFILKNILLLSPYQIYKEKLLPLEKEYKFHDFHSPALGDADFSAKPMVMLVGQYSTGKFAYYIGILGWVILNFKIPYARHYNPRFVYFLPHF